MTSPTASYLRRLAAESDYSWHAKAGYVCAHRHKTMMNALLGTADAQDRREVFRLRCLLGTTTTLAVLGVMALVMTSYFP